MKTINTRNFKRAMYNAGRKVKNFFLKRTSGDITLMISTVCCICIFAIIVSAMPIGAVNEKDGISRTDDTTSNNSITNSEMNDEITADTTIPETTTNLVDMDDTVMAEPVIIVKYVVESGDSFWSISKKFYNDAKWHLALMEFNGYEEGDVLRVGDIIQIPDENDDVFIDIYQEINQKIAEVDQVTGTIIKAGDNNTYKYGVRVDPTVNIRVPETNEVMKNYTEKVDTSSFTYLGGYTTTGYTPKCVHCCGNDKGIGAAGVPVICGYSVAAPSNIPLGTTLYIEGYGFYVVEDRGNFGNKNIDIACPTHESCSDVTNTTSYVNVYIVPNN